MAFPISLDPAKVNIPDDAWELFEVTEDFVTHRAVLERYADGTVAWVHRRTPQGLNTLLEANKEDLKESANLRFRDDYTRIGRIPLNVLYRDIAPYLKQGDKDHLKWWLNRDENRPFRSFRGKV